MQNLNIKTEANSRRKFLSSLSVSSLGMFIPDIDSPVNLRRYTTSNDPTQEVLFMSATKIAGLIRNKELTSVEVVQQCLDRIHAINPKINAVVQITAERALAEAKAADAALAKGKVLGPLHGVPMTIKDSFDTEGVISTAGTLGRKNYIPGKDATVVQRLRKAGAILMGKTNTPEFTMSFNTSNLIYGQTYNPYNLEYHPSGSSGGAAAIIAAGGSFFDIGTDSGGSVRAPSHVCGIAGIKPTSGRVPQTGHLPGYGDRFGSYQQPGPMARRVEDLYLLLQIIAGPDQLDASIQPVPLGDPAEVNLKNLKIGFYTTNGIKDPTPEIISSIREVAKGLEQEVTSVEEARPTVLNDIAEKRRELNNADGKAHLKRLIQECETKVISPNLNIDGEIVPVQQYTKLVEELDALRSQMLQFMADYDILLCPVTSGPALKVGEAMVPGHWYTSEYNATGWPAAVVRMGTSPEGLPLGIQIVGRPWTEDVVLAVAEYIEQQKGGFQKPLMV